jgi:hypothetical protein
MFIDDSMLAQCSQFIIPGQYLKYIKGKNIRVIFRAMLEAVNFY